MNIAVLGAGIAGLAVATRLKGAGHTVTVYEQNAWVGGKISEVKKDGFTWDGGPSFFTDPGELRLLFSDVDRNMDDYFSYIELDEACRYFYGREVLHGYDTPDRLAEELERGFGEPKEHTLRFLTDIATSYNAVGSAYLDQPFSIKRILSPKLLRAFIKTPSYGIFHTMKRNNEHYFDTAQARQFFDRFATYVGSDYSRAPGLLSSVAHLEHNMGAVQPVGGMRSIVGAIESLARELGVIFKLSTPIEKLVVEKGKACGIVVGGSELRYDQIVNSGDVANAMKWHSAKNYRKHQKKEHSSSAVVLYLGVKKTKLPVYLHNIIFSNDYLAETNALWKDRVPYTDPTIYINNTSYYEKSHAPKGYENWFVMANAPAGMDEQGVMKVRGYMLSKLSEIIGRPIDEFIVSEAPPLTPSYLEKTYSAYRGSIYGVAANSWRGAFFRPQSKDDSIKNLYHCGVTTHPGGGIPLALRSARIVAGMVG